MAGVVELNTLVTGVDHDYQRVVLTEVGEQAEPGEKPPELEPLVAEIASVDPAIACTDPKLSPKQVCNFEEGQPDGETVLVPQQADAAAHDEDVSTLLDLANTQRKQLHDAPCGHTGRTSIQRWDSPPKSAQCCNSHSTTGCLEEFAWWRL